jgi:methionine--tRNA ligase beta chain
LQDDTSFATTVSCLILVCTSALTPGLFVHLNGISRYLCKEASFGGELAFSEDSMRDMHNSDLCDTLGNLVNRATNLCTKFCDGVIPDVPAPSNPPVDFTSILDAYVGKMDQFDLQGGANIAIQGFRDVNRYLQDEAPWLKKGDENDVLRKTVVRATLEAIYVLTHLLMPFLPVGCKSIYEKLGKEPLALKDLNRDCRNLEVGTPTTVGKVLYEKSVSEADMVDKNAAAAKKKESLEEAQKRKKEQRAKQSAAGKKGEDDDSNQPEFTKVDIRVGKIVKVWNHASADKLFCEEIDVGEESGPREIASGLREFYSLEDMQDRLVLVVCNLKSAKIVGFNSNGMVLAAKAEDGSKVELITPPEGSTVGERVFIEGLTGEPFSAAQMKKKKTWDVVAKELRTGEDGVATWQGKTIQTTAGACRAASLVGAPIS